eukprot:TRINITY_DN7114_c0_g1_i1.p1 TRINITY_DN7114_c0_g1~~TRINITY_DN7114_c0_g1_i1.p1  ORF type:complete len:1047 (+),score=104.85 TRINITY_DN7114_c0_g1_i1:158-3142(+)
MLGRVSATFAGPSHTPARDRSAGRDTLRTPLPRTTPRSGSRSVGVWSSASGGGVVDALPVPRFTPDGGEYSPETQLHITLALPLGLDILYTTDSSLPAAGAPGTYLYRAPIQLGEFGAGEFLMRAVSARIVCGRQLAASRDAARVFVVSPGPTPLRRVIGLAEALAVRLPGLDDCRPSPLRRQRRHQDPQAAAAAAGRSSPRSPRPQQRAAAPPPAAAAAAAAPVSSRSSSAAGTAPSPAERPPLTTPAAPPEAAPPPSPCPAVPRSVLAPASPPGHQPCPAPAGRSLSPQHCAAISSPSGSPTRHDLLPAGVAQRRQLLEREAAASQSPRSQSPRSNRSEGERGQSESPTTLLVSAATAEGAASAGLTPPVRRSSRSDSPTPPQGLLRFQRQRHSPRAAGGSADRSPTAAARAREDRSLTPTPVALRLGQGEWEQGEAPSVPQSCTFPDVTAGVRGREPHERAHTAPTQRSDVDLAPQFLDCAINPYERRLDPVSGEMRTREQWLRGEQLWIMAEREVSQSLWAVCDLCGRTWQSSERMRVHRASCNGPRERSQTRKQVQFNATHSSSGEFRPSSHRRVRRADSRGSQESGGRCSSRGLDVHTPTDTDGRQYGGSPTLSTSLTSGMTSLIQQRAVSAAGPMQLPSQSPHHGRLHAPKGLLPCRICGREIQAKSVDVHERVCERQQRERNSQTSPPSRTRSPPARALCRSPLDRCGSFGHGSFRSGSGTHRVPRIAGLAARQQREAQGVLGFTPRPMSGRTGTVTDSAVDGVASASPAFCSPVPGPERTPVAQPAATPGPDAASSTRERSPASVPRLAPGEIPASHRGRPPRRPGDCSGDALPSARSSARGTALLSARVFLKVEALERERESARGSYDFDRAKRIQRQIDQLRKGHGVESTPRPRPPGDVLSMSSAGMHRPVRNSRRLQAARDERKRNPALRRTSTPHGGRDASGAPQLSEPAAVLSRSAPAGCKVVTPRTTRSATSTGTAAVA